MVPAASSPWPWSASCHTKRPVGLRSGWWATLGLCTGTPWQHQVKLAVEGACLASPPTATFIFLWRILKFLMYSQHRARAHSLTACSSLCEIFQYKWMFVPFWMKSWRMVYSVVFWPYIEQHPSVVGRPSGCSQNCIHCHLYISVNSAAESWSMWSVQDATTSENRGWEPLQTV